MSLNGASVTVRQAGASHPEKVISDNKTPYAFYYKVEYMPVTVAHEMEVTKDNTLEIKIPEVEQKTSVTVGNQAVGELLSMEVTAPQAVASKDGRTYTITYNLKLSAVNETVSEAVLKTDLPGGTWSSDAVNGKVSSQKVTGTVSSVRLDSVTALAFSTSRSSILPLIEGKKLFVNGKNIVSNAYHLKEGDIVSVRGKGKYRFDGTTNLTKKNRYHVEVSRYC